MIKINNTDIRIRPSSVDGFFQCAFQWGKVFLEGINTIPNSRAAIGTSIHAAAETLWSEAIITGSKDVNLSKLTDASMAVWKEQTHDGVSYDKDETEGTAISEILAGTEAFVDDIVPFAKIPVAVEEFYKIDIDHCMVSEIGGTVDYITENTIADLKTSKRKPSPANYTTQQSIYKLLAQANGVDVKTNLIQGVVLKKSGPEGMILPMESNVPQAKALINTVLDTLDLIAKDVAPIETILRPNPKYYLCSNKYCSLYGSCPATKSHNPEAKKVVKL
jgi:hypothetical protein